MNSGATLPKSEVAKKMMVTAIKHHLTDKIFDKACEIPRPPAKDSLAPHFNSPSRHILVS